jgi:hypothetical protein
MYKKIINSLESYCFRFINYTDEEKEDLRMFLVFLANATYGTFKDVPVYNRISPNDYLDYVMSLSGIISYTISNSHVDIFSSIELVPSVTELGLCYSYNGYIAPYNDYKYISIKSVFPSVGE